MFFVRVIKFVASWIYTGSGKFYEINATKCIMITGAVFGSAKNMAPVAIRSILSKLSGSHQVG